MPTIARLDQVEAKSQHSVRVSHVGQGLKHWSPPAAPQDVHFQEAGSEAEQGLRPGTSIWNVGIQAAS